MTPEQLIDKMLQHDTDDASQVVAGNMLRVVLKAIQDGEVVESGCDIGDCREPMLKSDFMRFMDDKQ